MEVLGTKLVIGTPTHAHLQHQQWRGRHFKQAHALCSPITLITNRSYRHPILKAHPDQQPIKPIAIICKNPFSANAPENFTALQTNSPAKSKPRKTIASVETNSSVESNPQNPIASNEINSSAKSNPQNLIVLTQEQVDNDNAVNLNLNPFENLKKIARAALLVATVSFVSLNAQGMLLCRPARAAWYWPFGKTTKVPEEETVTIKPTEKFWKNEKIPWDFKERVVEEIVENSRPRKVEPLKGLLALRMRDGDFDSAIEIVDTLMFRQPYEVEWRLVKAQILDAAGRLNEAKEEFRVYLSVDEFDPRGLQGLAMVMHKQGEDTAMIEMLEKRLEKAIKRQLDKETYNMKLLLAHAYILQDKLEEALKQYQQLIDQKPKDFRPYLCQGILYSVLGKSDEAEERFQKYRKLVPKHFPTQNFLDRIMISAKTEGHKRYEERKKEEELLAQGKTPTRPMKQPNIGEVIEDLAKNEIDIGEEIRDVPKSESNQVEVSEDLPESGCNRDGNSEDLQQSESGMDGDFKVLPESERSEDQDTQDSTEAQRKG